MSCDSSLVLLFEKMRLVALIIVVPVWLNNSVTVSSYEGFKVLFEKMRLVALIDHFSTGLTW